MKGRTRQRKNEVKMVQNEKKKNNDGASIQIESMEMAKKKGN